MNIFERAIGFIAPEVALGRERARQATEHLRSYDAAAKGRRTSSWTTTGNSQNTETALAGQLLRNRSRELCRNNPYVKRAVQSITNNTVGKGIKIKINHANKKTKDRYNSEWKAWWDTVACDFDDRKKGGGIQKMVMRAVIESGDCLILKRRNADSRIPIELQIIEIDYLDISKNVDKTDGGGFIFMGIEFDSKGKRKAYWLFDKHPGDNGGLRSITSSPRPATDVIHIFEQLRPGQQLGVPFGVSAFLRVRDMDEYNDAQVIRQKIAACYSVVITGEGAGVEKTGAAKDEFERIEPGMIHRVPGGETITFGTPPTVENFGEFSKTIFQGVAAGFGSTYENVTGDLNNVNFSSGRMGWIEHHRNIEDWQDNIMVTQLCDPSFEWFNQAVFVSKGLKGATALWTAPRREMIDPSKEVKGIKEQIRSILLSPQDAIAQLGFDHEEVLAETAEFNEKLDKLKIISDADARQGTGKGSEGRGRPATTGEGVDDDTDSK